MNPNNGYDIEELGNKRPGIEEAAGSWTGVLGVLVPSDLYRPVKRAH